MRSIVYTQAKNMGGGYCQNGKFFVTSQKEINLFVRHEDEIHT